MGALLGTWPEDGVLGEERYPFTDQVYFHSWSPKDVFEDAYFPS